jgi:hypothetical protein
MPLISRKRAGARFGALRFGLGAGAENAIKLVEIDGFLPQQGIDQPVQRLPRGSEPAAHLFMRLVKAPGKVAA